MNYVIIGNSAAAIGCIEGIRQVDQEGKITVISNECHHTYSRPLISYLILGKTDLDKMKYRSEDFYKEMNCEVILGYAVRHILKDDKKIVLEDNKEVSYDKLLVATGSRAFVPTIEGLETVDNKFTFMSLDDAKALNEAITPESRVLIAGAGLIGLKCAEALAHKVESITVCDLAETILSSILDEHGAELIKKHIEKQGVEFILSAGIEKCAKQSATLTNGQTVDFDILVLAVGVRPNTELVKAIGGEVRKGIVINKQCHTSIPNIYAAGDCTESYDITQKENRILALLPHAYRQGECAGINMAEGIKLYNKAIPMNAIGFFGLHMMTAGSYTGQMYVTEKGENYKKLVTKDGLLSGYILIGDVARAGIYTALIREEILLDTIDFELIKEKPQLMAFSKRERAKQLGGIKHEN